MSQSNIEAEIIAALTGQAPQGAAAPQQVQFQQPELSPGDALQAQIDAILQGRQDRAAPTPLDVPPEIKTRQRIFAAIGDALTARAAGLNPNVKQTDFSGQLRQRRGEREAINRRNTEKQNEFEQRQADASDVAKVTDLRRQQGNLERDAREDKRLAREDAANEAKSLEQLQNIALSSGVFHLLTPEDQNDPEAIRRAVSKSIAAEKGKPKEADSRQIELEDQIRDGIELLADGDPAASIPDLSQKLQSGELTPEFVRKQFRRKVDRRRAGGKMTGVQLQNLVDQFNEEIEPLLQAFEAQAGPAFGFDNRTALGGDEQGLLSLLGPPPTTAEAAVNTSQKREQRILDRRRDAAERQAKFGTGLR